MPPKKVHKVTRKPRTPSRKSHATRHLKWRKTIIGITALCTIFLWALSPIFIKSPDYILTVTVTPNTSSDCPARSACYAMELRNRGPWPISIEVKELQVYPSLIGPSVNVNWPGVGPNRFLVLMPFTGHTYIFWISILSGLLPPDRVYVVLTANITMLYVSYHVVLHSGKR
jgi:hypothetical protein